MANEILSALAEAQRSARSVLDRAELAFGPEIERVTLRLLRRRFRKGGWEVHSDAVVEITQRVMKRLHTLRGWEAERPLGFLRGHVFFAFRDWYRRVKRLSRPGDEVLEGVAAMAARVESIRQGERLRALRRRHPELGDLLFFHKVCGLAYRTIYDARETFGLSTPQLEALLAAEGLEAVAVLNAVSRVAPTSTARERASRNMRERYVRALDALRAIPRELDDDA